MCALIQSREDYEEVCRVVVVLAEAVLGVALLGRFSAILHVVAETC
jgi:hypothetical protein